MNKTILSWLHDLPDPERRIGIRDCHKPNEETRLLNRAIDCGIRWSESREVCWTILYARYLSLSSSEPCTPQPYPNDDDEEY